MDRISTATKAVDLFGAGKHGFKNGDLGLGVVPTDLEAQWFNAVQEEILAVIEAAALAPSNVDLGQLLKAIKALSLPSAYVLVRDQKATGTGGGASVIGANARTLNTVVANSIAGAALAANQLTLPAGTYRIDAQCPAAVNAHRSYLYNVTDAAVAVLGTSENTIVGPSADAVSTISKIKGRITIAAPKVFELRTYSSEAKAATGLGISVGDGLDEVYSYLEVIKEA